MKEERRSKNRRKRDRRHEQTRPCLIFLICINIVIFWIMFWFTSIEGENVHSVLHKGMEVIGVIEKDASMGKRNTYCDHLRHLVFYHEADAKILMECVDVPTTDLQKTIIFEGL